MTRNVDRRAFLQTTGVLAAGATLAGLSPRLGLRGGANQAEHAQR